MKFNSTSILKDKTYSDSQMPRTFTQILYNTLCVLIAWVF